MVRGCDPCSERGMASAVEAAVEVEVEVDVELEVGRLVSPVLRRRLVGKDRTWRG